MAGLLSGCGGSDDASTEAMPESVEITAEAALDGVEAQPVPDEAATAIEATQEPADADSEASTDAPDDDSSAE